MAFTRPIGEEDVLYYLHIPKTGGTSLSKILDNYFDYDSILQQQTWRQLLQERQKDFSEFRFIRGHFGYGIYRILPKKPLYITMLREPIERTISSYEHIKRELQKGNKSLKNYFSDNDSFLDLLDNSNNKMTFMNTQLRHIALDLDIFGMTKSFDKSQLEKFLFTFSSQLVSPEISDEKLLPIAKKRLEMFAFFGLLEKFEESLMLLYYTFGLRPSSGILRENASINRTKKENIPKPIIQQIKTNTNFDLQLYQFAKDLFNKRFLQMVNDLRTRYLKSRIKKWKFSHKMNSTDQKNINDFKKMMYELLELHYQDCYNIVCQKKDSINFNFNEKLFGSQWHEREFTPDLKTVYRWMGPDTESTIDFPIVSNSDMFIQLHSFKYIVEDSLHSLKLKVNDAPIELTISEIVNGKTIFEGRIPKSAFKSKRNFTRLTLKVNRTISPNSRNPLSKDMRLLGIAFEGICISPHKFPKKVLVSKSS